MDKSLQKAIMNANESVWNKKKASKISKKGLYEVWYTMVSDHERDEAYWIRYTLMCPKIKKKKQKGQNLDDYLDSLGGDAMLWLGYFNGKDPSKNFMVKKIFPLSSLEGTKGSTIVKINSAEISLDRMSGAFETKGGKKVSWDLKFSHFIDPIIVTPDIAKKLKISNTVLKATHPNLRISGKITINGESKDIKDAPGIQYHTLGDGYLDPWIWVNCRSFKDLPEAFFDIGFKKIRGVGTMEFFDGNESVTWWNAKTLKRLKVMKLFKIESTINGVKFSVEYKGTSVQGEATAPKESLIAIEYFGPQCNSFFCYNSELADLKLKVTKKDDEGKIVDEKEYVEKKGISFENLFDAPQEGIEYLPYDKEEL